MRAILILCALLVGCGNAVSETDMARESRFVYYYPQDIQLMQYLMNIGDRLDKLESLRGTESVAGDFSFTGTLTGGVVPIARMRRTEVSAKNSSAVTLLSGGTLVVSLDLGAVVAGDRIFVGGHMFATKGVTDGKTNFYIDKSGGTALYSVMDDNSALYSTQINQPAGSGYILTTSGLIKVTGDGTLTIRIFGFSAGSNATVGIGDGQIHALVLRDA